MVALVIRLKTQHGPHPAGSTHAVVRVVPHGGHTDAASQYVLEDGIHVCDDRADTVPGSNPKGEK